MYNRGQLPNNTMSTTANIYAGLYYLFLPIYVALLSISSWILLLLSPIFYVAHYVLHATIIVPLQLLSRFEVRLLEGTSRYITNTVSECVYLPRRCSSHWNYNWISFTPIFNGGNGHHESSVHRQHPNKRQDLEI